MKTTEKKIPLILKARFDAKRGISVSSSDIVRSEGFTKSINSLRANSTLSSFKSSMSGSIHKSRVQVKAS